ncbi:MAG: DUF5685 family protein, partial [Oscillospiraceae bacterium]
LASRFGPVARFTLSYDFTFIVMLHAALSEETLCFAPQRCPFNPVRKRPHLEACEALDYSCDVSVLLLDAKVRDNITDSGPCKRVGWRMLSSWTGHLFERIEFQRPEAALAIERLLERQAEVEAKPTCSVDLACDPTAEAMGTLLSLMSTRQATTRSLERLGYMLGRYIYLCDAIDDLSGDLSAGRFNPLAGSDNSRERFSAMLRATVSEACAAYALLDLVQLKGILDNIVYLGLARRADQLIEGRESHDRPI